MPAVSFLSSGYLWALLFVAVPVILHFALGRRTVPLRFSTTRFFSPSVVRSDRMRRIRRSVQLLARIAALTALVLLFARPYFAADPFTLLGEPHLSVYLWIDPSLSMSWLEEGVSLATRGQAVADTLRREFQSGGKVFVYDAHEERFVELLPDEPVALQDQRYGPDRTHRMFDAYRMHEGGDGGLRVLVLLSDFQQEVAQALASFFDAQPPAGLVVAASLGSARRPNAAVRFTGAAPGGVRGVVTARERSFDGGVAAEIDGMRVGYVPVKVDSMGEAAFVVTLPDELAQLGGVLVLEGEDSYPADNRAVFPPLSQEQGTILLAGDTLALYPIRAALRVRGYEHVRARGLAHIGMDDIEWADLVVLEQPRALTPVLRFLLGSSGAAPTAVIVSPLPRLSGAEAVVLAGGGGDAPVPVREQADRPRTVLLPDTISPLWHGFPRLSDADAVVYGYFAGLPGDVLATLDNAEPFVTMLNDSAGSLRLMTASPLGLTEENTLHRTGFYVAFLDRLVSFALSQTRAAHREWVAGFSLRNPYAAGEQVVRVFDADSNEVVRWRGQPFVSLALPGLYRLEREGGGEEWVCVVPDSAQAGPAGVRVQTPGEWSAYAKQMRAAALPGFVRRYRGRGAGVVVWLVLALGLLVELCCCTAPYTGAAAGTRSRG